MHRDRLAPGTTKQAAASEKEIETKQTTVNRVRNRENKKEEKGRNGKAEHLCGLELVHNKDGCCQAQQVSSQVAVEVVSLDVLNVFRAAWSRAVIEAQQQSNEDTWTFDTQ
jgi:hypothetical protein